MTDESGGFGVLDRAHADAEVRAAGVRARALRERA